MLKLNYEAISSKDLSQTERIILACKHQEFGAILFHGVLKVNKDLKEPKRLEKLVRKMFAVDHPITEAESAEWDALYEEICSTWGEELWKQLREAWGDTLDAKLAAEAREAATVWLDQYGDTGYTDSIDELAPGLRDDVIRAIYFASKDIRAVFNYGFQMGANYGVKEAAQ